VISPVFMAVLLGAVSSKHPSARAGFPRRLGALGTNVTTHESYPGNKMHGSGLMWRSDCSRNYHPNCHASCVCRLGEGHGGMGMGGLLMWKLGVEREISSLRRCKDIYWVISKFLRNRLRMR
jgi:hypothetical protein